MNEVDTRVEILRSILRSPHGDVEELAVLHMQAFERDAEFYAHFAAWYRDKGEVRDHRHLFTAQLLTAPLEYIEFRPVGRALLFTLSVRETARTVKYARTFLGGAPRYLRKSVELCLRKLENNENAFDNAVVLHKRSMKSLYASLHIKPSEKAQQILFDEVPPEGSKPWVVKQLRKLPPVEAARFIVRYRVPYLVAVGAVSKVTPTVAIALLEQMSPQEMLNNLSSLERRGLLSDPEVRKLAEEKIEAAKQDKRISTLKMDLAAQRVDKQLAAKVKEARDERVEQKVEIALPTALFIDKSGSMAPAIEAGKQIAALVAPIAKAGLWVVAFDTVAREIKSQGTSMSDWERAFKHIKSDGGTSVGSALEILRRRRIAVEQIVIVTDEEENTAPMLADVYKRYRDELNVDPSFIIVRVRSQSPLLEDQLNDVGAMCSRFEFEGDYYSLTNLLPLLSGRGLIDLVDEILSYPLPNSRP